MRSGTEPAIRKAKRARISPWEPEFSRWSTATTLCARDRPYRGAMTRDVALDYIQSLADKSYDPAVVDVLVEHIDEFEARISEEESNNPVLPTAVTFSQKQEPPLEKQDISKSVFDDIALAHREIQAVYEVSDSVGKTLNVSDTLALLVGKIGNLVPFDACAVFLANPHTNQLLPYHTSGEQAEALDKLRITVAEGVTGWVAANNQNAGQCFAGSRLRQPTGAPRRLSQLRIASPGSGRPLAGRDHGLCETRVYIPGQPSPPAGYAVPPGCGGRQQRHCLRRDPGRCLHGCVDGPAQSPLLPGLWRPGAETGQEDELSGDASHDGPECLQGGQQTNGDTGSATGS